MASNRPHDVLYDSTYTVSGARDFYKQQAHFQVEKVPEYGNFFSELPHYPAASVRVKGGDQVPMFVNRGFHQHTSTHQQRVSQSSGAQVNGPHGYKFHRQPLPPPGTDTAAAYLATQLAAVRFAPVPPVSAQGQAAPEPPAKDACTQSDFRESEVQTLPWTPGYVLPQEGTRRAAKQSVVSGVRHCEGPELLQLTDLKWGDGLPGGLQEVLRLEAAREKRAFEASLPPIDDLAQLPLRQAMIEQWEAREWAQRAEEIRGVQEQRLGLLEKALQVREEEIEEQHRQQVEERNAQLRRLGVTR
ncbi:hypothetical protein MNEG_10026 [Monoraphidium neglectum]|uniref:Cilia- and flagella-associated protein 91 n=1 Tax=Monoraphidium neglectum TaxID=145388 RepID=A0A0D2M2S7_9CHLO|nr:hypothetical protein MNEG_10026 [Monoraphidium neglectum]KIY97934.1 hypothetical protein MNEG_10026 [Monoraphidium neglectum]|eukprot:XP_013896954.1 hypothetical protein MNEG_10026 [Monoraphidium neglectum]